MRRRSVFVASLQQTDQSANHRDMSNYSVCAAYKRVPAQSESVAWSHVRKWQYRAIKVALQLIAVVCVNSNSKVQLASCQLHTVYLEPNITPLPMLLFG